MWKIQKKKAPKEYVDYIYSTPGIDFRHIDKYYKDILKKQILEDQGCLCCYCGTRINLENSTLEHLNAVSITRKSKNISGIPEELQYENILAACDGGIIPKSKRNGNKQILHCDKSRGNKKIPYTPLDPECIEDNFDYDSDGNIFGRYAADKVCIKILNLQAEILKTKRLNAIAEVLELDKETALQLYESLAKPDEEGKYVECCFAARRYIKEYYLN